MNDLDDQSDQSDQAAIPSLPPSGNIQGTPTLHATTLHDISHKMDLLRSEMSAMKTEIIERFDSSSWHGAASVQSPSSSAAAVPRLRSRPNVSTRRSMAEAVSLEGSDNDDDNSPRPATNAASRAPAAGSTRQAGSAFSLPVPRFTRSDLLKHHRIHSAAFTRRKPPPP